MKAVILVGGYGTRLYPFTFSLPKPIIELANKPMLCHQIEALKLVGCDEVILAVSYKSEIMVEFAKTWQKYLDITITISRETSPLGTAGPLSLIANKLHESEYFFVLNSDVICTYPLKQMAKFHETTHAEATVLLTEVEEPSRYGVAILDDHKKITKFVEKPTHFVGNKINAGIYLMNRTVLKKIQPVSESLSFETDIFPEISRENGLYGFEDSGFWMDIGKPVDFLKGSELYLHSIRKKNIVAKNVEIGENCHIGNNVSVGANCIIGNNVVLENCIVMNGTQIGNSCIVKNSIVGWSCVIGNDTVIENTLLGEDVTVNDKLALEHIIVMPHKKVKNNEVNSRVII